MTGSPRRIVVLDRPPNASVVVPGSKSHTNRALVCAALAEGTSTLRGALFADDTEAMFGALATLSIDVATDRAAASVVLTGCAGRLEDGPRSVDVRKSGTTGRFLLPALTLGRGRYTLDGHAQLRARPFGDLVDAVRLLGGRVEGTELPLVVEGGAMRGGTISVAGSVSSQFLSGLLLSAPCATGETIIEVTDELVSKPYVDLTLATMATFGAVVERDGYQRFVVSPTGYRAADVLIEPDASAASYFFAAAAITGGRVRVEGLGTGTVQGDLRFVDVLEAMGAHVIRSDDATEVQGPARLSGIDTDMADISDTAQTLAVVATFADGPSTIDGIGFIRRKETDRLAAVVAELRRRGIDANERADGLSVTPGVPRPGLVHTYDDHRMAMSFALLGLVHPGIEIADPACVDKTFPTYFDVLESLRS